uniref:Uncharacterized protein n=1 Tax=Cacopsylla melanoneura TaxID=428564 RepID=A0A8D9EFL2_9HEMI
MKILLTYIPRGQTVEHIEKLTPPHDSAWKTTLISYVTTLVCDENKPLVPTTYPMWQVRIPAIGPIIHPPYLYHLPNVASDDTIGPRILRRFQISNKTWGSHLNFLKNAQFFYKKCQSRGSNPDSDITSKQQIGHRQENTELRNYQPFKSYKQWGGLLRHCII